MSKADEISKWKKLFDEGSITEEEFNREKTKILSSNKSLAISQNQILIAVSIALIIGIVFISQNNDEITSQTDSIVEQPPVQVPIDDFAVQNQLVINTLEDIRSGVVQIEVEGSYAEFDEDFNLLSVESYSLGSGFLISPNGYIVTNNHVVAGASIVKVYFSESDTGIIGEVVAQSECSDLALLKIDRDDLLYFSWSDGTPKVGDEIYAAGYPLGDPEFTLLDGIVTKEQADGDTPWSSIESTFEHNAEIKSGNSGGPIISNSDFKVLGVNYAVDIDGQEFAINNDLSQRVINSMINGTNKPGFGINGEQVEGIGIILSSVDLGSPLDKSGVKGGDIITKIDGIDLSSESTLKTYCDILGTKTSSGNVSVEIFRLEDLAYYGGNLNSGLKISQISDPVGLEESSSASSSPSTTKATSNKPADTTTTTKPPVTTTTTTVYVDNVAPTFSNGLYASNVSETTVTLNWLANDNIGIDYYVLREGSFQIYKGNNTSRQVEGLNSGSSYTFTVDAYDANGNKTSTSTSIYTPATTTTTTSTTTTTTTIPSPTVRTPEILFVSVNGICLSAQTNFIYGNPVIIYNNGQQIATSNNTAYHWLGVGYGEYNISLKVTNNNGEYSTSSVYFNYFFESYNYNNMWRDSSWNSSKCGP